MGNANANVKQCQNTQNNAKHKNWLYNIIYWLCTAYASIPLHCTGKNTIFSHRRKIRSLILDTVETCVNQQSSGNSTQKLWNERNKISNFGLLQREFEPKTTAILICSTWAVWSISPPWPYLTFIVGTLVQSCQYKHQSLVYSAVWLRLKGPECRCNIRVSPKWVQ